MPAEQSAALPPEDRVHHTPEERRNFLKAFCDRRLNEKEIAVAAEDPFAYAIYINELIGNLDLSRSDLDDIWGELQKEHSKLLIERYVCTMTRMYRALLGFMGQPVDQADDATIQRESASVEQWIMHIKGLFGILDQIMTRRDLGYP